MQIPIGVVIAAAIIAFVGGAVLGVVIGILYRKKVAEAEIGSAE